MRAPKQSTSKHVQKVDLWPYFSYYKAIPAAVAELADAYDSKSYGVTHESSILSRGTRAYLRE